MIVIVGTATCPNPVRNAHSSIPTEVNLNQSKEPI